MSVGLGTLTCRGTQRDRDVEVWASNYDADELRLCASGPQCEVEITLDSRQLQELSIIIDRFLSS
jgi:hypothetical protein